MKQKVLIFHPALAPYRVDFFNELGKLFDLRVVFMTRNNANQSFNQHELLHDATYSVGYLDRHCTICGRNINLGYEVELKNYKPDIVICAEFGMSLWATFLYRKTHFAKFKIFTLCDDSEDVAYDRSGLRKLLPQFFITKIEGVICVNPKVADYYLRTGSNRVYSFPIIYHSVLHEKKLKRVLSITNAYIEKYKLQDKKCLLYVGRLTEVKNLKRMLTAFACIPEAVRSNYRLIIVGDGEQRQELEQLVGKLNINNNIIFTGRYEGLELLAWYNLDAVLVLLSTYERFGAVVGEALLSGQRVLVSDKVGAKCLVDEDNGWICPSDGLNEMTNKMCATLQSLPVVKSVEFIRNSLLKYDFETLMEGLYNFLIDD